MKKNVTSFNLLVTFLLTASISLAQEGMWIPSELEKNEAEMQAMGFTLDADDVYREGPGSMKDAVVRFGGGCTGEVISEGGLVLTNHHCGFGSIRNLSTVENNYLRDGFWAANTNEEIHAPGLEVMFIVRMEEVTDKILMGDTPASLDSDSLKQRSERLVAAATDGTHYGAYVQDYYYGNVYYLMVTETFKDIRLVGTPPRAIGEFGGETDNWIWPRHTGDFSLWRIYAGPDNKPADYSPDNKPFEPRYYFRVSLDGIEEDDFTMVFGFPGRTQEYLPSAAVKNLLDSRNPNRIALRELRIRTMEQFVRGNDTLSLMYASKIKGLANAYKKWQGESQGLEANDAIEKKLAFEKEFEAWAEGSIYSGVTGTLNALYNELADYDDFFDHTIEGALGIEAVRYARSWRSLNELLQEEEPDKEAIDEAVGKLADGVTGQFSDYHAPIDKAIFPQLLKAIHMNVDSAVLPAWFNEQVDRYNADFITWADAVYNSSAFVSAQGAEDLLEKILNGEYDALGKDPIYQLYDAFLTRYLELNTAAMQPLNDSIYQTMGVYMKGIMESGLKERLYADANSTLRVGYGKVKGYVPRNGVYYTYQTTHDGILEKHRDGDEEFDAPDELLALLKDGDFGRYANADDDLPVAFLASNHTTGGNSGSPVLNAKGELIGTNFDRVWEGTMSDVMYDFSRCRNISVDIRYTLYIIDRLGGAGWVVEEILR
jgi:hypothetical protein